MTKNKKNLDAKERKSSFSGPEYLNSFLGLILIEETLKDYNNDNEKNKVVQKKMRLS